MRLDTARAEKIAQNVPGNKGYIIDFYYLACLCMRCYDFMVKPKGLSDVIKRQKDTDYRCCK